MEKTSILKIFEILLRKIPSETFKQDVHRRIIGEDTQNNEITKKLVMLCHNGKKNRHYFHDEL